MEKELELLQQIHNNQYITQRDLASNIGISIGSVNLLIKKMIKTGLIKIEKLNARTMQYILTPKGLAEKASKTYQYITESYKNILQIEETLIKVINQQIIKGADEIYLFGDDDEIYKIVQLVLDKSFTNIDYKRLDNVESIKKYNILYILTWTINKERELMKNNVNNISIINIIEGITLNNI